MKNNTDEFVDQILESRQKLANDNADLKDLVESLEKQLAIQGVTFCLLTEKDKTFEDWVHNNFNMQGNCFVNKINETVTYSKDALIDLYDFYCDRFIAN